MSEIENSFLNQLIREHSAIFVYLINGVRLEGYLVAYDAATLILTANLNSNSPLLVYRNVIATVQQVPVAARYRFRKAKQIPLQQLEAVAELEE